MSHPLNGEDILAALASGTEGDVQGLAPSRLAALTGRDRGLVGRIVEDLLEAGLLDREPNGKGVRLSWELAAVATRVVEQRLTSRGQRVLDRLARETGESTYLVARQGALSVTVAEAMPDAVVQGISWIGRAQPVARGDAGPVLLSDLTRQQLGDLLGGAPLPPSAARNAPRTIDNLWTLIEQACRDQTSWLDEAVEPNVSSIAAPVSDFRKRLVGAIAAVGPSNRIRSAAPVIRRQVLAAAAGLTRDLGGSAAAFDGLGRSEAAG